MSFLEQFLKESSASSRGGSSAAATAAAAAAAAANQPSYANSQPQLQQRSSLDASVSGRRGVSTGSEDGDVEDNNRAGSLASSSRSNVSDLSPDQTTPVHQYQQQPQLQRPPPMNPPPAPPTAAGGLLLGGPAGKVAAVIKSHQFLVSVSGFFLPMVASWLYPPPQIRTFSSPLKCNHCTSLMVGLTRQGVVCEVCGFACHIQCREKVPISCPVPPDQSK